MMDSVWGRLTADRQARFSYRSCRQEKQMMSLRLSLGQVETSVEVFPFGARVLCPA